MELPWGMFGENLTITGLLEETVHIGDHFQVGSANLVVTQPRLPCYKLGIKFGRDDILKRFPTKRDDWILLCRAPGGRSCRWRLDQVGAS